MTNRSLEIFGQLKKELLAGFRSGAALANIPIAVAAEAEAEASALTQTGFVVDNPKREDLAISRIQVRRLLKTALFWCYVWLLVGCTRPS